jgi:hypothetical protein
MSLQDLILNINRRDLLIKKLEEDIQKDQATLIILVQAHPRDDITIEWHQRNILDSKTTIQGHKHVVAEILLEHVLQNILDLKTTIQGHQHVVAELEHVLAFLRKKELN